jgi:hypothetical protein
MGERHRTHAKLRPDVPKRRADKLPHDSIGEHPTNQLGLTKKRIA